MEAIDDQVRQLHGPQLRAGHGFAEERTIRADVFVFAVQRATDPNQYDPFDVAQWDFYVVGAPAIAAYGYRSANLAWVQKAAGSAVTYLGLAEAVRRIASSTRTT